MIESRPVLALGIAAGALLQVHQQQGRVLRLEAGARAAGQ
jgi:hypothetical protein